MVNAPTLDSLPLVPPVSSDNVMPSSCYLGPSSYHLKPESLIVVPFLTSAALCSTWKPSLNSQKAVSLCPHSPHVPLHQLSVLLELSIALWFYGTVGLIQ